MVLKMKCISILHAFKKGDPGGASILYMRYLQISTVKLFSLAALHPVNH